MADGADNPEFHWSLHMLQLPIAAGKKISSSYDVGQLQYIKASNEWYGACEPKELKGLKKHYNHLDINTDDKNYESIIMPAVKAMSSECNQWKYSQTMEKIATSMQKQNGSFLQPTFTDDELLDFCSEFNEQNKPAELHQQEHKENIDSNNVQARHQIPTSSHQLDSSGPKMISSSANKPQTPFNFINKIRSNPSTQTIDKLSPNVVTHNLHVTNSSMHQSSFNNVPPMHRLPAPNQGNSSFRPVNHSSSEYKVHHHEALVPRYPWQRKNRGNFTPNTSAPEERKFGAEKVHQGGTVDANNSHGFRTASHQLVLNQHKQNRGDSGRNLQYGAAERRSLGTRVSSVTSKFVPPVKRDDNSSSSGGVHMMGGGSADDQDAGPYAHLLADPRLKNIDGKMVELIMNEVLDVGLDVSWDDIAGLQDAKATIQEVVVWPMLRPDIFTGLRGPPKGVLLFGPPGTGKTMIGKAIASQSGATFFSISASCLTSKWIGEGEKMVRALFAVARVQSPSVIFIDEIDSLLCQRSESEHESSRRLKTEFLVQLDGVGVLKEQVLVVGATNRPHELDEAARRRLVKRLYIPLPDKQARLQLIEKLLMRQTHDMTAPDIAWVADHTEGYSGADVSSVCSEAAMGPIRGINPAFMQHISLDQVRAININDFKNSVSSVKPSVCADDLLQYHQWNMKYGIVRTV